MSATASLPQDRRTWSLAGGIALACHALVALAVLGWARTPEAPMPEPVVLVELPADAAPAPAEAAPQPVDQPQAQPEPQPQKQQVQTPPIDLPPVRAPLPASAVTLPLPQPPLPSRAAPPPAAPAQVASVPVANTGPGADPRARKAEVDYFSLVSAYLNRRKTYPPEAKRAREEGVVTIRFTVDREGNVSATALKRSSGHDTLDQATLALLQRVSPLPKMPPTMQRQSVTLALPIEYTLKTN